MGRVPVICEIPEDGAELSRSLQRSGLSAPLAVIGRDPLPDGDVYVLVDGPGLKAARHLQRDPVGRGVASRTIAYAATARAQDLRALDSIGIRYYCNAGAGLQGLYGVIGQIRADVLVTARERAAAASATADTVVATTAAMLTDFGRRTGFDGAPYAAMMNSQLEHIRSGRLYLLTESLFKASEGTLQHCSLVTAIATAFAATLGFSPTDIERVFLAAFFHDVGKAGIPASVLDKPGKLTAEEMELVRTHPAIGHQMLLRFPETAGEVAEVALRHHEMLDGSGYPDGLGGAAISDLVRLVTIADIFSALIERRSYKPPVPVGKAYDILVSMGPKLDQDLVRAFRPVAESAGGGP